MQNFSIADFTESLHAENGFLRAVEYHPKGQRFWRIFRPPIRQIDWRRDVCPRTRIEPRHEKASHSFTRL